MPKAIARIAKLKGGNLGGSIAASEQHTNRLRDTPNANPSVSNLRFIGQPDTPDGPDLCSLVMERIGEQTIRKNAVLCVEMLLTTSPEFFRPDEPDRAGYYEPDRLESFKQTLHQWLNNTYGDLIVRAELHLDEATPHVHAYLVPLDERGKLNCRGLFGGREKLSKFQDSYAQALEPLGVERGIKGSRATHTQIKDYYASVTQELDEALDIETIRHQLADRKRALKEKEEMERTARSLEKDNELLQHRVQNLEGQLRSQLSQIQHWKTQYQGLANQLRALPLEEVAYELGLNRDPKDLQKWRDEQHLININGSKFYDWRAMKGGGGAIDLVMQVQDCPYQDAVLWLNEHFGEPAVLQAVSHQVKEVIREAPPQPFVPPVQDHLQWESVKNHLTRLRKLPEKIVDALHEAGLVYADAKQNAVFIRRSFEDATANGASLQSTVGKNNLFHRVASGTRRSAGWFYLKHGGHGNDPIQRAVLCKSPIDTISFAVTDRSASSRTVYLAIDDGRHLPIEFLRSLPEKSVIIAVANDPTGEAVAQTIREQLSATVRQTPKHKDWNDDLQQALNSVKERLAQQQSKKQSRKQLEL
jgi:Plasmid recombination enzyme/Toprim-like/Protein of unknown function (DUF3991)